MRNNNVVIDATYSLIHFPHLTMPAKNAAIGISAKPQPVSIQDNTTVPPMTTKLITAFVDHPSEWHKTGNVTPVGKFTEAASMLISQSISTTNDKRTAVGITNAREPPYLIKTHNCWIFRSHSGATKFIRQVVDTAILSMIPEGDPDLTTYLSELLRTNKPEQQSNTFWFTTPENPGEIEDHTPMRTRIFKKLRELQEKVKVNPKDDVETRTKSLKGFYWTDTLLTKPKNRQSKTSWSSTMI